MNIQINTSIIPILVTVVLLIVMLRPYKSSGQFDFGAIFRLFYLIPMMGVWAVYFAVLYFINA